MEEGALAGARPEGGQPATGATAPLAVAVPPPVLARHDRGLATPASEDPSSARSSLDSYDSVGSCVRDFEIDFQGVGWVCGVGLWCVCGVCVVCVCVCVWLRDMWVGARDGLGRQMCVCGMGEMVQVVWGSAHEQVWVGRAMCARPWGFRR